MKGKEESKVPLFFNKTFIKNGFHDTIHIFKNYFATIFLIFSKISRIQNPNTPYIYLFFVFCKIIIFCFWEIFLKFNIYHASIMKLKEVQHISCVHACVHYESIRSSRCKYYVILPHQKPTLLFYHIILQYLIYQMFYIFTTSFKYYILMIIL